MKTKLIITCEHGGNEIPPAYKKLFKAHGKLLNAHHGLDIGALELAKYLKNGLVDYHKFSTTSRLLVDLNRSLHHKKLFSSITKKLSEPEKQKVLNQHYYPYRDSVESFIQKAIKKNFVIHLSIHSFTPKLKGEIRNNDIGFLYDPKRKLEKTFSQRWKNALLVLEPTLKIRFNYPYRGDSDALVSYLRKRFSKERYLALELEINQKLFFGSKTELAQFKSSIKNSLKKALNHFNST
ncbi:MAG: N-formylglutamate amidohydrolase [Proteobacteria bacterium]|nr:N-formylglutamate amidohydrolase [Pseudomonadota bacterium]